MTNNQIDLIGVADELAEIARTTTDERAGRLLVDVVRRLLEAAGLPPAGAGHLPPSDPLCALPAGVPAQ